MGGKPGDATMTKLRHAHRTQPADGKQLTFAVRKDDAIVLVEADGNVAALLKFVADEGEAIRLAITTHPKLTAFRMGDLAVPIGGNHVNG